MEQSLSRTSTSSPCSYFRSSSTSRILIVISLWLWEFSLSGEFINFSYSVLLKGDDSSDLLTYNYLNSSPDLINKILFCWPPPYGSLYLIIIIA
jgi:hypothetical protein